MKHQPITPASYYVTVADYGDNGLGHACDPSLFDEACDAYVEAREEGRAASVFRMDTPTNGSAGMMVDVTDDAEARIAYWLTARRDPLPEWLAD